MGVALLQLPWEVVGVMLAGSPSYYAQQQTHLTASFHASFGRYITLCFLLEAIFASQDCRQNNRQFATPECKPGIESPGCRIG